MPTERWSVAWDDLAIPIAFDAAADAGAGREPLIVFAHGAGSHMDHALILRETAALRAAGLATVRFNFPYRAAGRGRPDRMEQLTSCFEAVIASVRERSASASLLLGGQSMGGRAASMLAADGFICDGLILLAYPLHPADNPQRRRDAHLDHINAPVLCINGTRDRLCRRDLMDPIAHRFGARWTMKWIDGADHTFRVLKRSGRTEDDVFEEISGAVRDWLSDSTG